MTYTAHQDTFARDNLPPKSDWPEFLFELPELQYPERLNCAVELLDKAIEKVGAIEWRYSLKAFAGHIVN